jgi:hypothetical protein
MYLLWLPNHYSGYYVPSSLSYTCLCGSEVLGDFFSFCSLAGLFLQRWFRMFSELWNPSRNIVGSEFPLKAMNGHGCLSRDAVVELNIVYLQSVCF